MKKLMLIGAALALIACGCTQLAVSKLQSTDEAEWRAALVEIQKDYEGFLSQNPMSGPEKLGRIAMNEAITYPYGADASYPAHVRKAAVEMLGSLLPSDAIYKHFCNGGRKGNNLTGFYDEYNVSELAFDQLVDIFAKTNDEEIRKAVVKQFDNPQGYNRLLDAPKDGYHGVRSDKSVANVLVACSDNRYSFMFDYYCKAGDVKQINLDNASSKEALSKGLDHNAAIENAPKLAGQAYLKIPNPTIEQSKKALVFCNETKQKAVLFAMVDTDEPSDAQILAATRVPEKDMRELLAGLRERDPKTYWFIWSKCATPDEALKVYNSKADASKKLRAVGRLGNEKLLTEIAKGENEDFTIAAVRALHNTAVIAQIACDKRRDTKVRMSALERLVDRDLILENKNADVDAITKAVFSFDYTSDLGDAYAHVVKGLANIGNQTEALKKINEVADMRVKQIVADGESVKDDTFCCNGIRLGMYNWELKFLNSVRGITSGIGNQMDVGDVFDQLRVINTVMSKKTGATASANYVTELVFWGEGIKNILGISGTTIQTIKDVFSETYGDGGDNWDIGIYNNEDKGIVVHVKTHGDKLPPRFKGREATPEEKAMLQKENILKAGEVKGYVQAFFTNDRIPRANKGDVYQVADSLDLSTAWEPKYSSCNCSPVVKQAVNGGVVVGCVKAYQNVRTGTYVRMNGPGIPECSEFRFPNRIFVKTEKKYADGDRFDVPLLKYIGTTTHKGANGSSITMHTFEPYQVPDCK